MPQFLLHQALAFNPQSQHNYHVSPLLHWDIRLPPPFGRLSGSPRHSHTGLPPHVLAQPATNPPVPLFRITMGVLPAQWTIEVRNSRGVTVGDVLDNIYKGLRHRVSSSEWRSAPRSHQVRVGDAYYARCKMVFEKYGGGRTGEKEKRYEERAGVRRVDWLVKSSCFVGLTPSVERGYTWTLTTKRVEK